jgi:hypothetical protein
MDFPIIGTLDNGTRITVIKNEKGWLEINQPLKGWVAANRTEPICQD